MTTITTHALARWMERFGGDEAEMREAVERSQAWGGQLAANGSHFQMDEVTRAVFVVRRGEVRTVLTERMAIANQQMHIGVARGLDLSPYGRNCATEAREFEKRVQVAELRLLAKRHAELYRTIDPHGTGYVAERKQDFRQLGYAANAPEWETYKKFYEEACRERSTTTIH